MNDMMSRISAIRARFAPPVPPVEVRPATVTSTTDFATALRVARSATSGGAPRSASAGAPVTAVTTEPGTPPAAKAGHDASIARIATEEGVPASLLSALVWSESSYDEHAVSPAGARGLAQLMPSTAVELGVNVDDPLDNLRGGARYLRQMLDRFGRVDLALAAYNAGPGAVQRAGGVPNYAETQRYVAKVQARAELLEAAR